MMDPRLCENCQKRQKFRTHKFCGKTCAAQASAKSVRSKQSHSQGKGGPRNVGHHKSAPLPQKKMCIHCNQKPQFNGFDYCGKSCAASAGATQKVPATKQHSTHPPNTPPNAPSPAKPYKAPQSKGPIVQDDLAEEDEEQEQDSGITTDLDAYPSDSVSEPEDEPSAPAVTAPQSGVKSVSKGGKRSSGAPETTPGICTIPGCGQPVHVDRHGAKTKYCSIKHREEAVKLGLEAACIMCRRYPQSTLDYFCSTACRNQSMTKT